MHYTKFIDHKASTFLTILALLFFQGCFGKEKGSFSSIISNSGDGSTCGTITTPFNGGSGTLVDPYLICTVGQLNTMNDDTYVAKSFKLAADIDLGGSFTPFHFTGGFQGSFDGDGKTLSNLIYSSPNTGNIALFQEVDVAGVITNLKVSGFKIEAGDKSAAIAAQNRGTISNSVVSASVIVGEDEVGGLVGYNTGTITTSLSSAIVIGSNASASGMGGLVGYNQGGTIDQSGSSGSAVGTCFAGGFAGTTASGGLVKRSFSIADVFVTNQNGCAYQFGGFAGQSQDVEDSFSTGTVYGEVGADYFGGFTGIDFGGANNTYTASPSVGIASGGTTAMEAYGGFTMGASTNGFYYSHAGSPGNTSAAAPLLLAAMTDLTNFTGFGMATWQMPTSGGYNFPILAWQSATDPFFGQTVDVTPYKPIDITQVNGTNTYNGVITVGDPAPPDEPLTVSNNTGGVVTFTSISIALGNSYSIGAGGTCTSSTVLANGQNCTINLHFLPTNDGMKADAVMVEYTLAGIARKMGHLVTANASL